MFRCYHGALVMLTLQTSAVGYSAAACKGLGFALTGDPFMVDLDQSLLQLGLQTKPNTKANDSHEKMAAYRLR